MIIQHFLFFYYMGEFTPYFYGSDISFSCLQARGARRCEEAFYLVGEGGFFASKESWKLKHKGR